jgi:superfamily II DNA or RNA helicase
MTTHRVSPEVGQAVRVRNRPATVRTVEPYDSQTTSGRVHLVEVEYLDDVRYPETDQVLWEAESSAQVLGATSLPAVDTHRPDSPGALRAFVNSHRWTRVNRLRTAGGTAEELLLGVWNSAIQVQPYQLECVLRALEMPRVSLLLADGVGLGKTIQAGLVLEELLLRRRVRRVLVLCPAMLQRQWRIELKRKFNLDFEIIDADSTFKLRRQMGIDTNPWKAYPRVITSMDYLRMADVKAQFLAASGADDPQAGPRATWDLLIADEVHHFAPQAGNRASQRTQLLRDIRFLFEHRVFASATPHNGKTVCFTGLLELLDPVRFQMTVEMDEKDKQQLAGVCVRRLKEDINRISLRPPFADQLPPVEIPVRMSDPEGELFAALRAYRKQGQARLATSSSKSEQWLGQFLFSLMSKRLLSCPFAFARTWWRHLEESPEDSALFDLARVSAERSEDAVRSDDEKTAGEDDAARYGGAWLRGRDSELHTPEGRVSAALNAIGYDRATVEDDNKLDALVGKSDAKTEALVAWVRQNLFDGQGHLRPDERVIVFTEYKETLHFLERRFRKVGFDNNTMRLLFGGMTADEFEQVKNEFEDPVAPVRLLLATDAASEGVNMQESCRWVVHYDVPWNPSRLQQRNGRVSRHGQVRDVSVHYFRCDQEEDMEFLLRVARKVDQVREDLGSVERVFDAAIQQHFQAGNTPDERLYDLAIDQAKASSAEGKDLSRPSITDAERMTRRASEALENTDLRLGISPTALADILRTALAVEGKGTLEEIAGKPGFFRLKPPPRWESLVKHTLTVGPRADRMEIVFDAALVEKEIGGRTVMRLQKHQSLLRLGHPVMRQAMSILTRQLHASDSRDGIYRWSIAALHRGNFEAMLVFHYTVTGINELRDPLHDEVCTRLFRVEGDQLAPVEDAFAASVLREPTYPVKSLAHRDDRVKLFRGRWPAHRRQLEAFLKAQTEANRTDLQTRADAARQIEKDAEAEGYRYRIKALQDKTVSKELMTLSTSLAEEKAETPTLFAEINEARQARISDIEKQMEILRRDMDETRERLERERDYRLKELLPRRFRLRDVRVLPLAVEFLIPATAEDLRP